MSKRIPETAPTDRSIQAEDSRKVEPSPACPGFVKHRPLQDPKTHAALDEILTTFKERRRNTNIPDEQALIELMTRFDLSLRTFCSLAGEKIDASFSMVTWEQIAPIFGLDPIASAMDMRKIVPKRSRISNEIFQLILDDLSLTELQYGALTTLPNEEAVSRYMSPLIVALFGSVVVNKPEGLLDISVLFIEIKRKLGFGPESSNVKAQVLAGCAGCDSFNDKRGIWAPILAIISDGLFVDFIVFDSADGQVFSSGWSWGIQGRDQTDREFIGSIKRTFINGVHGYASRSQSRRHGPEADNVWEEVMARAEAAHWYLREGAELDVAEQWRKAEEMARKGIALLSASIEPIPRRRLAVDNVLHNGRVEDEDLQ
ncbi:hypothetical protein BJX64DRAFT_294604 [Aspergillus heterothallicus]